MEETGRYPLDRTGMDLDRLDCAKPAVVRPHWPDIRYPCQKQCHSEQFQYIICFIPGHPWPIPAHFGSVHSIPFHLSVQKLSYGVLRKQEVLRCIVKVISTVIIISFDLGE